MHPLIHFLPNVSALLAIHAPPPTKLNVKPTLNDEIDFISSQLTHWFVQLSTIIFSGEKNDWAIDKCGNMTCNVIKKNISNISTGATHKSSSNILIWSCILLKFPVRVKLSAPF
jgi:hypothetical protein